MTVDLLSFHEAHMAAVRECRETIQANYVRRHKATEAAASEAMLGIW